MSIESSRRHTNECMKQIRYKKRTGKLRNLQQPEGNQLSEQVLKYLSLPLYGKKIELIGDYGQKEGKE